MSRVSAASRTARPRRTEAHLFAALGDPIRLSLVRRLSRTSPLSITELAEGARITRQAITKHLRVLEHTGIVRSKRHGRQSLYEFTPDCLADIRRFLDRVSAQWDDALKRLKAYVED